MSKATEEYKTQRAQIVDDQAKLTAHLEKVRKDSAGEVEKQGRENDNLKKQVQKGIKIIQDLAKEREQSNKPMMDTPAGEIRWVDQRSHTVWINLGRADALDRQTTFSVYSIDSTDLGKGVRKGSIEVTNITGEHSSEARIVDDKNIDPIMPGDKIHTPLWAPGERIHFALAGTLNLDGSGRDEVLAVRNLINMNGGTVDCYQEGGKCVGEITSRTRYLVLGDEPTTTGAPGMIQAYGRMIRDAERLGARKITLSDLKQKMGYKQQSSVQRFGGSTAAVSEPPKPAAAGAKAPAKAPAKKAAPKTDDEGAYRRLLPRLAA